MKKEILSLALGLLLPCAAFGQTPADWAIDLPLGEKPLRALHRTAVQGGENVETMFAARIATGKLVVARTRFPREVDPQYTYLAYEGGKKSLERKSTILSEEDILMVGWPGKRFVCLEHPPGKNKSSHAVAMIGQELYSVVYTAELERYDEAEARRILASVARKTGEPKKEQAQSPLPSGNTPADWKIAISLPGNPFRMEGSQEDSVAYNWDDGTFFAYRLTSKKIIDPESMFALYANQRNLIEKKGSISLEEDLVIAGWPGKRYVWTGKTDGKKRSEANVVIGDDLYSLRYTTSVENYREAKALEILDAVTRKRPGTPAAAP